MFSAKTSRDVRMLPQSSSCMENQPMEKYRSKKGYAMTF